MKQMEEMKQMAIKQLAVGTVIKFDETYLHPILQTIQREVEMLKAASFPIS